MFWPGEDRLAEVEADLGRVDVERGDELDVADVVAAELDVHEPGHVLGRVGVAVVLDALQQAARAVADAGDGDTDLLTGTAHAVAPSCSVALGAEAGPPPSGACCFGCDQVVDPLEVALGGSGAVLHEGAGVAIDGRAAGAAGAGQAVGELGAAALEEREARGGVEEAAERELQREEALVVAGVVGGEQREELLLAARGDPVGLAGAAPGRARARGGGGPPRPRP